MSEGMFTCVTCHVAFGEPEGQRKHFQTEWHSYNLKRKVASLSPLSLSDFNAKLEAQQAKTKEEEIQGSFNSNCVICKKHFASENSYLNHLSSKKHKENEIKYESEGAKVPKKDAQPKPAQNKPVITDDMTEEEIIDQKISASRILEIEECIFCCHKSSSFEENMDHMTTQHSLFIPDIEYIVDLQGFMAYLGKKISVGNTCLYCNGKGRSFHSLEAVQKHMIDKGHCKILYEGDSELEYSDFYDFRPSYPDYKEGEEMDDELNEDDNAPIIAESEVELVLPNGKVLGHRSLNRYYKQKFKTEDYRTSAVVDKLKSQYRALGWYKDTPVRSRERIEHLHDRERFLMEIGVQANILQRHFRRQVDY